VTNRSIRAAIDGLVLAIAAPALLSFLLRRPALAGIGAGDLAVPWGASLLLLMGLLALRGRLGARAASASATRRPSPETLVLLAAFFAVLSLAQPSGASLGGDSAAYVQQLKEVYLHGHSDSQRGVEPGASILWAPFFLLGHAVARAAEALGLGVAAEGEGAPYRNALRLGAAAYALLAAALAQRAAARFVSPLLAAVCAAGLWLGSSLFHYTVAEPAMAHAPATAVSSLLLLLWLRARERPERVGRWLVIGLVGGLLVAIQRYDVYLLLPVALSGASFLVSSWRAGDAAARRRTLLVAAGVVAVFAASVTPLVLLTLSTPDRYLLNPDVIRSQMLADWARPHVTALLFASNGGLFAWTPLVLLAVPGLVALAWRDRRVGLSLLATLALGVYVLASNPTWWAGYSFGARRLTEAYPILVLGLCVVAEALLRRPWSLGVVLLALAIAQNVLFSAQMRKGRVEPGDATSFLAVGQGAAADFHEALGHPGSWPANWVFAWKHGVSPGRFDELYGRVPRDAWVVRLGTPEDGAILGRGWSRPLAGPAGRWAEADETTLLVTLTAPADRWLRLRGAAARHPEGREQVVRVEVGGRPAGEFTLSPAGRSWEVLVPAASWVTGLNEVRFLPAWRLLRQEAWAVDEPPFVGWRLETVAIEPAG
jgi:hypothetical protein